MAVTSTNIEYPVRSATTSAVRQSVTTRLDQARAERFAVQEHDATSSVRRHVDTTRDQVSNATAKRDLDQRTTEREARADRRSDADRAADTASRSTSADAAVRSSKEASKRSSEPVRDRTAPSSAGHAQDKTMSGKTASDKAASDKAAPPAGTQPPASNQTQAAQDAGAVEIAAGEVEANEGQTEEADASGEESESETSDKSALSDAGLAPSSLLVPPPPSGMAAIKARTAAGSAAGGIESGGVSSGSKGAATTSAAVPVMESPGANAAPDGDAGADKAFEGLLAGQAASPGEPLAPASAPPASPSGSPLAGTAASSSLGAASAQAQAASVPLGAVPMTIGLRSLGGSNRFEISLDPKDLGRIDVNLDIDKDNGTVTAHLVVDRPETLALLQRDAGNLQQALSQAGFEASDASINLSLRSDTGSEGRNGTGQNAGDGRTGASGGLSGSDPKDPRLTLDAVPLRSLRGLGGIDIRI